jgi:hypothetical protein
VADFAFSVRAEEEGDEEEEEPWREVNMDEEEEGENAPPEQ